MRRDLPPMLISHSDFAGQTTVTYPLPIVSPSWTSIYILKIQIAIIVLVVDHETNMKFSYLPAWRKGTQRRRRMGLGVLGYGGEVSPSRLPQYSHSEVWHSVYNSACYKHGTLNHVSNMKLADSKPWLSIQKPKNCLFRVGINKLTTTRLDAAP